MMGDILHRIILQTVGEWYSITSQVGLFIIFFVIGIPVAISILMALFSRPRNIRISGLMLLGLAIVIVVFIVFVWLLGAILSLIIS